ncbi:DegT/DnrJ/EryC1/StrS family aminotransferase [Candidatus Poribacteria bacterium]|nr:DegT/DnrJ/EryC1/StrS family aminotransferase [Candidatus Poribacteria bacterium]
MIPSNGTPIHIKDLLASFLHLPHARQDTFIRVLMTEIGRSHGFLANSATTLIHIVLKALRKFSNRREVILPAYTAPLLMLAIHKAGLTPKPCDISLETFQLDLCELQDCLSSQTLAVLGVHSFGIPVQIQRICEFAGDNGSYVLEDAAVADGSRFAGKPAGSFGDVSFISFNRGKNMSTFAGGVAFTDDDAIADVIQSELESVPTPDLRQRISIALKLIAMSFAVRPWIYTLMYSQISKFKDVSLHEDFDVFQYTEFQAGIGCRLMKHRDDVFRHRAENGRYLQKALSDISGVHLPAIPEDAEPMFNQFPMLVEDASLRDSLREAIIHEAYVEATVLYPKPVNLCYNLGISQNHYPNADYFAPRLLLIPTNPFITMKRLEKVVGVIRKFMQRKQR